MYGGDKCAGITISYLRMKLFRTRTEVGGERKIMGQNEKLKFSFAFDRFSTDLVDSYY